MARQIAGDASSDGLAHWPSQAGASTYGLLVLGRIQSGQRKLTLGERGRP